MNLTFITGNPAKAEQLSRHLDYPVEHKKLDLPEIQSLDLTEIVEHKAKEAYKLIQGPVLVEDTSLTFVALGKLPGPLIKWFLNELDNNGLCKLLNNYNNRTAVAEVCFGFYDGKELKTFEAQKRGTITKEPKGERGFGWDPIFTPDGYTKTWSEMTEEEQKETSMRRVALKQLEAYLQEVID
ncbi:MAG TPA: non-canonical purine NTP pyrophosphatase [Candidatus Paceibacterota bacterium]